MGSQSRIGSYFGAHWPGLRGVCRADLDLLDAARVEQFFRQSGLQEGAVLLLAARNRLRITCLEDAAQNLRMAQNVCRGLGPGNSVRLVFFSTIDVYGPCPVLPVTESTPASPADSYAAGKWEAEEFLRREFPADRLLVLRLPGVFGIPGDMDSAIAKILRSLKKGESPFLTGGGQIIRDYLWAGDLLRAVRHFLAKGVTGTWNLVSGESRTMLAMAQACAQALGTRISVQTDPRPSPRDYDLRFNITRLEPFLPIPWPTPLEISLSRFLSESQSTP